MDNDEQLFLTNVKGSAAANFITGLFVLVLWILKNKCKHSKCRSHNCCFDCEVKEDDEDLERGQSRFRRQETIKVPDKTEIRLQKLFRSKHHGIFQKHKKAIPTD